LRVPKSTKSYSALIEKLRVNAHSIPTPAVQPVRESEPVVKLKDCITAGLKVVQLPLVGDEGTKTAHEVVVAVPLKL